MEAKLTLISYVLLFPAAVLSLMAIWRPEGKIGALSVWAITGAFAVLTLAIAHRSFSAGRLPFATLYEFTLLFVWGMMLLFIIMSRRINSGVVTSLVALVCIMILSYGSTLPTGIRPLMPALQSVWLEFHVITAIVAYGAFGVSFCLGIAYLIKIKTAGEGAGGSIPSLETLDRLMHWAVVVGFPFMTLVIITGAVWAEEVWGNWWSWDPKEVWSLITWFIYAAYLHARKTYGWHGKRAAIIAVVGFLAVLFTLFGVSLLLPGAHSYV